METFADRHGSKDVSGAEKARRADTFSRVGNGMYGQTRGRVKRELSLEAWLGPVGMGP